MTASCWLPLEFLSPSLRSSHSLFSHSSASGKTRSAFPPCERASRKPDPSPCNGSPGPRWGSVAVGGPGHRPALGGEGGRGQARMIFVNLLLTVSGSDQTRPHRGSQITSSQVPGSCVTCDQLPMSGRGGRSSLVGGVGAGAPRGRCLDPGL